MSKTDTVASKDMKTGRRYVKPIKPKSPPKKTTTDFFDKLSKTETFASKDMKGQVERRSPPPEASVVSGKKKTTVSIYPPSI